LGGNPQGWKSPISILSPAWVPATGADPGANVHCVRLIGYTPRRCVSHRTIMSNVAMLAQRPPSVYLADFPIVESNPGVHDDDIRASSRNVLPP